MTIKKRIIGSSLILMSLLFTMGVVNWFGNNAIMDVTSIAYLLEQGTMNVQGIFRGVNEFIIYEGEPLSIELTNKHLEGFEEIHSQLIGRLKNHDTELLKAISEEISPQWEIVREGVSSFLKDNPYISVDDDQAMLQYGKLTTETKALHKAVETLAEKTKDIAETEAQKTKFVANAVAAIVTIIITVILFNLYRAILLPIKDISDTAEGFSRGNLSVRMNDTRKDEFGNVASHFNTATEKLNVMISNVKSVTDAILLDSNKLSSSSLKISQNSTEQSTQTSQAATAMEELNTSFVEVAKNTAQAAESSKEATKLATQGGQVVSETINGMNKISLAVNESAQTIEELGIRSEQIGEIIKVINDIAGQTNLLALNAAIEAARAGEQGRGFAVVADEVRKLAERTTTATNEIGEMIKGFQEGTQRAVESMHAGTKEVESGVELSNHAGDSLKKIMASAESVTSMVHHIATAAEEQSATGDVIASNVEAVAELTQQTAKSTKESSEATHEMNRLIHQLKNLVSEFKLNNIGKVSTDNPLVQNHHPNSESPVFSFIQSG